MNKILKLFMALILVLGFSYGQDLQDWKGWIANQNDAEVTETEAEAIAELADAIDGISTAQAARIWALAQAGDITIEDLTVSDSLSVGGALTITDGTDSYIFDLVSDELLLFNDAGDSIAWIDSTGNLAILLDFAAVDAVLTGDLDIGDDVTMSSTTPDLSLWDTANNTDTTPDTAAVVIEADGAPSLILYATNGETPFSFSGDDYLSQGGSPSIIITDTDVDVTGNGDSSAVSLLSSGGGSMSLFETDGSQWRLAIISDTLCVEQIGVDTLRLHPSR